MAVTHAPKGFTGTVDQVAEAQRFGLAGPRFRVGSSADWAPSVVLGVDRTVQIAAGTGYCCGVIDPTVDPDTVQFAANAGSQDRYDALVASFDWTQVVYDPGTGTVDVSTAVSFQVIQGTTSPPQVNTTLVVDNAKINRIPGVRYDGVIAIQRVRPGVGAFSSGDVADGRVWGARAGQLSWADAHATVIDAPDGTLLTTPGGVGTETIAGRMVGSDRIRRATSDANRDANIPDPVDGQYVHRADLHGLQVFDNNAWRTLQPPVVIPSKAALDTVPKRPGLLAFQDDTNQWWWCSGAYWHPLRERWQVGATGNSLVNNLWQGTAFSWVPGLGAKQTIPADDAQRRVTGTVGAQVAGDGYLRFRVDRAGGTTTYLPNSNGLRTVAGANAEARLTFDVEFSLDGSQAATVYLEARAASAGSASFYVPTVSLWAD